MRDRGPGGAGGEGGRGVKVILGEWDLEDRAGRDEELGGRWVVSKKLSDERFVRC